MSEENVELLRRSLDIWNRGDYEAWIATFDERCEFRPLRAQLEGRTYHGHEGVRRFIDEMLEEWAELRFELGEVRAEGDRVAGVAVMEAQGRASGVDLQIPVGIVVRVRAGKAVEGAVYSDPQQAFAALRTD